MFVVKLMIKTETIFDLAIEPSMVSAVDVMVSNMASVCCIQPVVVSLLTTLLKGNSCL